jgi:flagellar hook-length control protein FliK
LGQMFFDIAALANYFINRKDQTNPAVSEKTEKSGSVSFEDFLASLSSEANSGKQETADAGSAFALPVLLFPEIANKSKNANGEMPFYVDQKNIGSNPYQIAWNSNIQQTEQTYPNQPVEAFESSSIQANEIRDMVKSQVVTVTLNIDQNLINNNKMNTDLDLLGNLNQVGKPSLSFPDTNPAAAIITNPAETNLTKNFDCIDQGKLIDLSLYTKLSFAIDKLLTHDQAAIDIKAFDHNNNLIELKAPVEQLKQITENYPDNIIVQIKSDVISKQPDSMFKPITMADKTGKYILFDLKSLIAAGDFDDIKVVYKTITNTSQSDRQAGFSSPEIDLLNSIRFNNKSAFIIKDNSIFPGKINKIDGVLDRSAIGPKEKFNFNQNNNSLHQENRIDVKAENKPDAKIDQTEKTAFDYSSAKASEIVQTAKDAGSSSNRSINETNLVQQLNLRTSDTPVYVKSAEPLPGKSTAGDNLDRAEKIIGQIKSKFETAPEYTRMTINLKPESLGKIKLDFEYEGEKIKALLQVDNSKVKSILDADLPRLKHELKIDSIKVEIALSDFRQNSNQPNQRSHFANHDSHHLPRYSKFNEPDEIEGKINSELMKPAKVNVYHGGIINLLA